jgi:hypothetical protein
VGLERSPLNLVSTIEELLIRRSSGSGRESREYGRGDSLLCPRNTYPHKLALTSSKSGRRSAGIVRSHWVRSLVLGGRWNVLWWRNQYLLEEQLILMNRRVGAFVTQSFCFLKRTERFTCCLVWMGNLFSCMKWLLFLFLVSYKPSHMQFVFSNLLKIWILKFFYAILSSTSAILSVGIVRSRTEATEFKFSYIICVCTRHVSANICHLHILVFLFACVCSVYVV